LESAAQAKSAAGAGDEFGPFLVLSLAEKTIDPNNGAVAVQICAAGGSSGKISSADFSTNMGWTLDWPGQAGKFITGVG
jgi:hypothetical protein